VLTTGHAVQSTLGPFELTQFLSSYALIFGAELDFELEQQTADRSPT